MSREIYDKHFDDEHHVLRNNLGIIDAGLLEIHIARLSYVRVAELEDAILPGHFDIPHLRAIHRCIFQNIFPWAGLTLEENNSASRTSFATGNNAALATLIRKRLS